MGHLVRCCALIAPLMITAATTTNATVAVTQESHWPADAGSQSSALASVKTGDRGGQSTRHVTGNESPMIADPWAACADVVPDPNSSDQKDAREHRKARIAELEKIKKLPSYLVMTDVTKAQETFAYIFDSDQSHTGAGEFIKRLHDHLNIKNTTETGSEIVEAAALLVSTWAAFAEEMRAKTADIPGVGYASVAEGTKPILANTVLAVPVGQTGMKRAWVHIEGLAASRALPQEILYITGIDPANGDGHLEAWLAFRHLLERKLLPMLPKDAATGRSLVRVRWGVHHGEGRQGISRLLAAIETEQPLMFCFDADDFLAPMSLSDRYRYMMTHPAADLLLSGATYWENSKDKNAQTIKGASEGLAKALLRINDARKDLLGETDAEVATAINQLDFSEQRAQFAETFEHDYAPRPEAELLTSFTPGSLKSLPSIFYAYDCPKILSAIIAKEWEMKGKYDAKAELDSMLYLQKRCLERAGAMGAEAREVLGKPTFVQSCANGWNVIRTEVMRALPAARISYGEDALMNYNAEQLGFNVICEQKLSGGIYNLLSQHLVELGLARGL